MATCKPHSWFKGKFLHKFSIISSVCGETFAAILIPYSIFNSQKHLKASTGCLSGGAITNKMWRRHRNRFTWSFIKNKRRWLGSWYLNRQGDKLPSLRLASPAYLPPSQPVPAGLCSNLMLPFCWASLSGTGQLNVDCRLKPLCWISKSRWSFYYSSFCCEGASGGVVFGEICALRIFNVCIMQMDVRSSQKAYLFIYI